MDLNPPKLSWNKLFCKLCLVDGPVLEYIEWKVNLSQVKIFDTIEICVVEWFESCWHNFIDTIYLSTLLFTQYILTLVHSLNTIYQIIYFNTVWVGWGPHTQFIPWWPFYHVKKITSQHDSNYWTTYVNFNCIKNIYLTQLYFSLNIF